MLRQHLFQLRNQGWQVVLEDPPDNIEIDVEVSVDQTVAGTRELPPGDAWRAGLNRLRDMRSSFTHDLEQSDDGERKHLVRFKLGAPVTSFHPQHSAE